MVKIEAGKYYRTRDGEKVGPMAVNNGIVNIFPFATYGDDGERINSYTANGSVNLDQIDACGADIISEWSSSDFDPNWPHGHVTRDGRKARVVCMDANTHGDCPIIALCSDDAGRELATIHKSDGRFYGASRGFDLLNAPAPKREWWVNVYADGRARTFSSRGDADIAACDRIACVHVTEGDGL